MQAKIRSIWPVPFLVLFGTESQADETHNKQSLDLEASVVSATRTQTSIASIPGSVQIIDEKQISQQTGAGRRLSDLLGQLIPGVSPTTGGMSNLSQSLRGRNMLVLIDGVSQNATRNTYRQLNSISPNSIERIEVISGATSIYGAGASGGIINIITKRNKNDGLVLHSKIGLTSPSDFNAKGFAYEAFQSASGREGSFDWYGSANLTQRNDQYDGRGKRIPQDTSQGSNMDTETYDLQTRLGLALSENQTLSLSLQDYKDAQDTAYTKDPRDKVQAIAVKGLNLRDQPYTRNKAINFNYGNTDFHGQGLQIETYWRQADALFFPARKRGHAGIANTNSVQDVHGARIAVETELPSLGDGYGNLVWGADYSNERSRQSAEQYRVEGLNYEKTGVIYELGPDLHTRTHGLFAQTAWYLGDWTLRSGVRQEWIRSKVADSIAYGEIVQTGNRAVLEGDTLAYSATLYNVGAVYQLNDQQNIFANFSQGFSLPDVQRFLREVTSSFDIQSLNAQAIKVDSYELGWRGNWDKWQTSISAYENISNVTQFYDAKARVLRLIDQRERVRGIETSIDYAFDEHWKTGGTYAWTKGETRQLGKWLDLPATRVAPAKTTTYVEYLTQGYDLRLQAMHLAGYRAAAKDNNGRKTDGYTTVDVIAGIELPVGRLEAGIYNVTNATYQTLFTQANSTAPYTNAQGRTLSLSYSTDW